MLSKGPPADAWYRVGMANPPPPWSLGWLLAVAVVGLGCGSGDGVQASAEGLEVEAGATLAAEDAVADAAEDDGDSDGDDEAVEEEGPTGPLVDVANGHVDGQMGERRSLFFGLARTAETRYLQDGRVLVAYTPRTPRTYKVGDGVFADGRWWFGPDERLRQHTITSRTMKPARCLAAAAKLTEDYGPPTKSTEHQRVWVGERVMARWTERYGSKSGPVCEVEWIDLPFFKR